MPPPILDASELAEKIGASPQDVLDWHRRGIVPSIKANGRVYFNLGQVVKALRERQAAETLEAVGA
jgi:hypothetical protein